MQTIAVKKLREILAKHSGRDVTGQVSIRHRGGRHKRYFRIIDWKRDKDAVPARVVTVEFDPNRSANISLLNYADGEKRYILAPVGLTVGSTIISGGNIDPKIGNCLQLKNIPIGTMVHSVEIKPGRGAKMIRSAGVGAMVLSKDENSVHLKLPSGEIRSFSLQCKATVGQIGNVEWKNRVIGKAGRNRHLGKRPEVRGVAQDPRSHPHGGGEGRSGIGMKSPKSPWGKRTLGKKTRKKKKYSDKFIIQKKK